MFYQALSALSLDVNIFSICGFSVSFNGSDTHFNSSIQQRKKVI